MDISSTTAMPYLPPTGPDLAAAKGQQREEAAEALEAVFASLLVKEMRNTLSEGFFAGDGSDVFGGMFDQYMGEAMTAGRGIGVRQAVLAQFEQQSATPDDSDSTKKAAN